ncbi:MAG: NAD(P)H-hydrate dehydratase [Candidatus Nanopelagicaceae bacterium]|nr:NAD(P)H-hydrate dehydratase [Candidatus Nanopelagicaceae bacterium]
MSRRKLSPADNKYIRGVVAVCAGSKKFPGAAILAVGGARRGNAGYVKYLSSNVALISEVVSRFPDVVPIPNLKDERVDSLLVGPGASTLAAIPDLPLVLDGEAIAKVKTLKNRKSVTVITPHEGELKYLGFRLDGSREEIAKTIAAKFGVIVVLKGNRTVVTDSNRIYVDRIGGPELATAGTGDVLAGLIASFLTTVKSGGDAFDLVCDAVSLHSKAGRQAAKKFTSVTALEVLEELRNV